MRGAVSLLALALAACAPAPASEAPRPAHPELVEGPTIVSLNPCTDAILVEVADPAQILALSHYSHDPASSSMVLATARRFASTGGTVEEVLALRPDVTVSGNFISPATVSAMEHLGLRLEQLPIASNVAASVAQVRSLARLAGHPERGEALIVRIEAALIRAAPTPGSAPVSAVVWQSGGMVPGGNSLIAELLSRTGFASFSAAKGMKQADILPLEAMLADPPELIFAAGNARANEDRLLDHPALAALKATQRERLDPSLLWCGGPTIIRAVERLAEVRRGLTRRPRLDLGPLASLMRGRDDAASDPRFRGDDGRIL